MLKKSLVAVSVATMLLIGSTSARADNSEEVIIGVMGGIIGGLIIGEAIEHGHRHKVRRYVYEPQHGSRTICDTIYIDAYDRETDTFIRVPKRECWRENY